MRQLDTLLTRFAILLWLVGFMATVDSEGEKLPLSEVPVPVLEAVNKEVSGGEIEAVEREHPDVYIIEKTVNGIEYEIEVRADGVTTKVTMEGDGEAILSNLPVQVVEALNKAVPGGEILEVEKEFDNALVVYEIKKLVGGASYEIEVTADGVVREVEKDGVELEVMDSVIKDKPTVYVDMNSTQTTEDGTQTAPYKTIGNALENAPPGSLILVQSGAYRENIIVSDERYVKGIGNQRPIVQAADNRKPTVTLHGNASLEFLKITGSSDGIVVNPSSRVRIAANEIGPNVGDGIKFRKPEKTTEMPAIAYILDNLITQNNDGIDLEESLGLIQNNQIFQNRDDGIDYDGDSSVKTIGNTITKNKDDGIEIRLYRNVSADIEGNMIAENGEDGIEIIDTPVKEPTVNRIYIRKNLIRQNARYGIGCVSVQTEEVGQPFTMGIVFSVDNVLTENQKGPVVEECGCQEK